MTPIRKLFIANRAEIALRIVRTARRLGIATVLPWHAADRHGPALQQADETVQLFGEPPVAAFLDIAEPVDIAHPAAVTKGTATRHQLRRALWHHFGQHQPCKGLVAAAQAAHSFRADFAQPLTCRGKVVPLR